MNQIQPIAETGVLLHVGVHKTGTTAVQAALAKNRTVLANSGVTYPGDEDAQHRAAMGLLGKTWGWRGRGGGEVRKRHFRALAKEVRGTPGRVIVSSEFFCEATDAQAAEAVRAFAKPVHVVITVRNLGYILPSSWQQYLKNGLTWWYSSWLKEMLANPPHTRVNSSFWRRHDLGRVTETWARAAGAENVTVVVLTDETRDAGFRTIEALAKLPAGVLAHSDAANRSMTEAEAFTVIGLNKAIKKELSWNTYVRLIRNGLVKGMVAGRSPDKREPKLATPDWALDRAAVLGAAAAARISASGVNVVGDVNELSRRLPTPTPYGSAPLPIDAAIIALGSLVDARKKPS